MTRSQVRLALAAVALFALSLCSGSSSAEDRPTFFRKLVLPVATDQIGYPLGVTADLHQDEIFVCDTRRNRILIFDSAGVFTFQIIGGDLFTAPRDVAVAPDGRIIAVANHLGESSLIELDFDGLFQRLIPLPAMSETEQAPVPISVAISPSGDRLFTLDSANLQVWITDRDGNRLGSVNLAEDLTEKQRQDVILGRIDVYRDRVLVPIASQGMVETFDLDGKSRSLLGRKGTSRCQMGRPFAAALDEKDQLIVVDRQRMVILKWDVSTNKCLGEYYSIGRRPGYLYFPSDLALDAEGRIFISQGYEGRVQMYTGLPPASRPSPVGD